MDEKLYSIKETTLTDIADALRRKHGETKMGTIIVEEVVPDVVIVKTPNATGYDNYIGTVNETYIQTVKKNGATKIVIDLGYSSNGIYPLYIISGEYNVENFPINDAAKYATGGSKKRETFTFENTDSVTICYNYESGTGTGYFYGECLFYDADGNKISSQTIQVEKEEEIPNTYSSDEMAKAIDDIEAGEALPEEVFVITGDCSYRFASNGWNWFLEKFSDRITTKDITNASYMFSSSGNIKNINFEINASTTTNISIANIFSGCNKLEILPKINNMRPSTTSSMFLNCQSLREVPDDFCDNWDWSYINTLTSAYQGSRSGMFQNCYSLRKFPMEFLSHGNPVVSYTYGVYNNCFNTCYALDEIIGLPFPHLSAAWTSNTFGSTFSYCSRIKNLTFDTQDDGSPYVVKWKSQTIDLNGYIGYINSSVNITNYNSGITADKQVKDDTTYQALKDDADWWTTQIAYSRYNHDSAVNTINSLPDTSAYLATAGGTNTIKFKGTAGSATDGGAINTLTAEEIAQATVKGWTVTLA